MRTPMNVPAWVRGSKVQRRSSVKESQKTKKKKGDGKKVRGLTLESDLREKTRGKESKHADSEAWKR